MPMWKYEFEQNRLIQTFIRTSKPNGILSFTWQIASWNSDRYRNSRFTSMKEDDDKVFFLSGATSKQLISYLGYFMRIPRVCYL